MATYTATPGTLASVVSSATSGDTIILSQGQYTSWSWKSGLTYRAYDHAIAKPLIDDAGHFGKGFGVVITCPLSPWSGYTDMTLQGPFIDHRGLTGSFTNNFAITGTSARIKVEDFCVASIKTNGGRNIFFTVDALAGAGHEFNRFRFNGAGIQYPATDWDHDHAFYFKSQRTVQTGWTGTPFAAGSTPSVKIRDFIIDQGGAYPFHHYPGGKGIDVARGVIFRPYCGVVVSGNNSDGTVVGQQYWANSAYNRHDQIIIARRRDASGHFFIEHQDEYSGNDDFGFSGPHDNQFNYVGLYQDGGLSGFIEPGYGTVQTLNGNAYGPIISLTNVVQRTGSVGWAGDPTQGFFNLSSTGQAYQDGVSMGKILGHQWMQPNTAAPPSISINQPLAGTTSTDTLSYNLGITNWDATMKVEATLVQAGVSSAQVTAAGTITGTLTIPTNAATAQTFRARVYAADGATVLAESTVSVNVTTTNPTVSPVTNLTATPSETSISLSWTNPSLVDEILVRRSTSGYPAYNTGTPVSSGSTVTSVNDTGLTGGQTYYYSIFVRRGTSYSVGVNRTVSTTNPAPPVGQTERLPRPTNPRPTDPGA